MICLQELLVACIEVAKRGGKKVKEVRQKHNMHVKLKGKTAEGVDDPVTEGDMYSHKEMYYGLLKMFPHLKIVSEEESNKNPDPADIIPIKLRNEDVEKQLGSDLHKDVRLQDVTVWIDPLDATKEYTEDLMDYVTTMVCVAHKGVPIIGVIHKPFKDQMVWAWKGHGRSKIPDYNVNLDSVNSKKVKIIISRSHAGNVEEKANKVFGKDNVEIIPAGGAGYKSLEVAARNANAYLHVTAIKKWDICAGNALLNQVGGKMTDLSGNEIDYSYPGIQRKNIKLEGGLLGTTKNHYTFLTKINGFRNNTST